MEVNVIMVSLSSGHCTTEWWAVIKTDLSKKLCRQGWLGKHVPAWKGTCWCL